MGAPRDGPLEVKISLWWTQFTLHCDSCATATAQLQCDASLSPLSATLPLLRALYRPQAPAERFRGARSSLRCAFRRPSSKICPTNLARHQLPRSSRRRRIRHCRPPSPSSVRRSLPKWQRNVSTDALVPSERVPVADALDRHRQPPTTSAPSAPSHLATADLPPFLLVQHVPRSPLTAAARINTAALCPGAAGFALGVDRQVRALRGGYGKHFCLTFY